MTFCYLHAKHWAHILNKPILRSELHPGVPEIVSLLYLTRKLKETKGSRRWFFRLCETFLNCIYPTGFPSFFWLGDSSSQATIRPKRQFVPNSKKRQFVPSVNSSHFEKATIRPICKKRQFVPNCLIDQLITNLLKAF